MVVAIGIVRQALVVVKRVLAVDPGRQIRLTTTVEGVVIAAEIGRAHV